eukprot:scaffold2589_cov135-Skeletonema_marinoi.AAC.8
MHMHHVFLALTFLLLSPFSSSPSAFQPALPPQNFNANKRTMMSATVARRAQRSLSLLAKRALSTPAAAPSRQAPSAKALAVAEFDSEYVQNQAHLEGEKSEIQKYQEQMNAIDRHAVFAVTTPLPDPVLPENKSEIAALDSAHKNQIPLTPEGHEKIVVIKQEQA